MTIARLTFPRDIALVLPHLDMELDVHCSLSATCTLLSLFFSIISREISFLVGMLCSWQRYGPKVGWIILASRLQSLVPRNEKSVSLSWAR